MNYIKINHSHLEEDQENYIYFLELNDDNMFERQIITNISKDKQKINKLVYGSESGYSKWEDHKFNDLEIEKDKISKEEFDKYWNK